MAVVRQALRFFAGIIFVLSCSTSLGDEEPIEVLVDRPQIMWQGMRLERVSRQGTTLTREITLLDVAVSEIDVRGVDEYFRPYFTEFACQDKIGRRKLEVGDAAKFILRDEHGEYVAQVAIAEEVCPEEIAPRVSGPHDEAKASLLMIAVNQERYFRRHSAYAGDLSALGFSADPYITELGPYSIGIVPGDHSASFTAVARYIGDAPEAEECQQLSISGTGKRQSSPRDDCWN